MSTRVNLLGLTRPELEAWCVERGGKAFRARQLFQWIYKRAETDFGAMTDLAKDFRAQLAQEAEIRLPEIITRQDAADGTVKWMLKAGTGEGANQGIEMVYIPDAGRATVYRTLELLASVDVLTRILQADGHPAYVVGEPGHRHHLVCSTCGTTVAFTACPVDQIVAELKDSTRFDIVGHHLEVFGICPDCTPVAPASN